MNTQKIMDKISRGALTAGCNHIEIDSATTDALYHIAIDPRKPMTATAICNALSMGYHLGIDAAASTHAEAPLTAAQRELFNAVTKLNDTEARRALRVIRATVD